MQKVTRYRQQVLTVMDVFPLSTTACLMVATSLLVKLFMML